MTDAKPARQRSLRDHNLALALGLVSTASSPLSRARIAALSGLTRATASALVEELLEAGLVCEVALPRTARSGRPATGIALSAGGLGGLGLEINVDYLAATVVDLTGAVVEQVVAEGDQRGRDPVEVLAALRSLALATQKAARPVRVVGAALALPGLLRDRRLLLAPNLGWRDVDIRLGRGLEPALDNEANYAALAEVTTVRQSFVHVSGEIGIGMGIVVAGNVYRGTRGWSGEIGHLTVEPDGPRCSCGARGCLEVFAGQEAIARHGAERAGTALGTALAGVLNVLDLNTVVLGGSYAGMASALIPAIQHELRDRVLWAGLEAPVVEVAVHGRSAAVLGAARSVVTRVLSSPRDLIVTGFR